MVKRYPAGAAMAVTMPRECLRVRAGGPLLDVQLDPRMIVAIRRRTWRAVGKASRRADLGQRLILGAALRAMEASARSGESVPEMRRRRRSRCRNGLAPLKSAEPIRSRAGTQAAALERADGLQAAKHADGAVVHPGGGMASMCEPVATAGQAGLGPAQRKKVLADSVLRMERPSAVGQLLEPRAGAEVRRA